MDFLRWWWWQVLSEDTRESIFVFLSVTGIVAAVVFIVYAHMWFYPWIFCVDLFLWMAVSLGYGCWYFPRQYKSYQERDEEEEEVD